MVFDKPSKGIEIREKGEERGFFNGAYAEMEKAYAPKKDLLLRASFPLLTIIRAPSAPTKAQKRLFTKKVRSFFCFKNVL